MQIKLETTAFIMAVYSRDSKFSKIKVPADSDGVDEFNAIDFAMLEEGNGSIQPPQIKNLVCCLLIAVTGATFAGIARINNQVIT